MVPSDCKVHPWTPHGRIGEALSGCGRHWSRRGMHANNRSSPDWPAMAIRRPNRERQVAAAQKLYVRMGSRASDAVGRKMAISAPSLASDCAAARAVLRLQCQSRSIRERRQISACKCAPFNLALTRAASRPARRWPHQAGFPELSASSSVIPANVKLLFRRFPPFGYEMSRQANTARVGRAAIDDAVRFHR